MTRWVVPLVMGCLVAREAPTPPGPVASGPRVVEPSAERRWWLTVTQVQRGEASVWTGHQRTAWGQWYSESGLLCAHRTARRGQGLRVTCRRTGRSVLVVVADRGPWRPRGRILDLSPPAAAAIGLPGRGTQRLGQVTVEFVERGR